MTDPTTSPRPPPNAAQVVAFPSGTAIGGANWAVEAGPYRLAFVGAAGLPRSLPAPPHGFAMSAARRVELATPLHRADALVR